jgi:hypothetical protein
MLRSLRHVAVALSLAFARCVFAGVDRIELPSHLAGDFAADLPLKNVKRDLARGLPKTDHPDRAPPGKRKDVDQ